MLDLLIPIIPEISRMQLIPLTPMSDRVIPAIRMLPTVAKLIACPNFVAALDLHNYLCS